MRWLSRLLRRNVVRRPHPPPLPDARGRAQKIARLVTALNFYADANNYAPLRKTCPIARDGGRRARHVLALLGAMDNGRQQ